MQRDSVHVLSPLKDIFCSGSQFSTPLYRKIHSPGSDKEHEMCHIAQGTSEIFAHYAVLDLPSWTPIKAPPSENLSQHDSSEDELEEDQLIPSPPYPSSPISRGRKMLHQGQQCGSYTHISNSGSNHSQLSSSNNDHQILLDIGSMGAVSAAALQANLRHVHEPAQITNHTITGNVQSAVGPARRYSAYPALSERGVSDHGTPQSLPPFSSDSSKIATTSAPLQTASDFPTPSLTDIQHTSASPSSSKSSVVSAVSEGPSIVAASASSSTSLSTVSNKNGRAAFAGVVISKPPPPSRRRSAAQYGHIEPAASAASSGSASALASVLPHTSVDTSPGAFEYSFRYAADAQEKRLAELQEPADAIRDEVDEAGDYDELDSDEECAEQMDESLPPLLERKAKAVEVFRSEVVPVRHRRLRMTEEEQVDALLEAREITRDSVVPLDRMVRPWNLRFLRNERRQHLSENYQPTNAEIRCARPDPGRAAMFNERLEAAFGPGSKWRGHGSKPSKEAWNTEGLGASRGEGSGSDIGTSSRSSEVGPDMHAGMQSAKRTREQDDMEEEGSAKRPRLEDDLSENISRWNTTLRALVKGKVAVDVQALDNVNTTLAEIDSVRDKLSANGRKVVDLIQTLSQLSTLEGIPSSHSKELHRRAGGLIMLMTSRTGSNRDCDSAA
ncbi:hypothetical protein PLICRDRAFT_45083 [Plicaturopsis crispa FD-325 SS-3]|nr:hypothetical protein PLICRDRAFT_45083 [Plicaturopsis crispa FD-325 SS-3]